MSRLVVKIRGGHRDFNAALADSIQAQIQSWVAMIAKSEEERPQDHALNDNSYKNKV